MNPVLIEFVLHLSPALDAPIQIDTNLVREQLID